MVRQVAGTKRLQYRIRELAPDGGQFSTVVADELAANGYLPVLLILHSKRPAIEAGR